MSVWFNDEGNLKVWRVILSIPEVSGIGKGQAELVVASKSRIAAARLFGCSDHDLKTYGGETGNAVQRSYALAAPGIVFYQPLNSHDDQWKPMGGAISAEALTKVQTKVDHVMAVAGAQAKGQAVWKAYQFGCGARLRLPAFTINVEMEGGSRGEPSPGFKVTIGDTVLKKRFPQENDAKIAGLALARRLLDETRAAFPDDPLLEE